jgi:hypothetical protein
MSRMIIRQVDRQWIRIWCRRRCIWLRK